MEIKKDSTRFKVFSECFELFCMDCIMEGRPGNRCLKPESDSEDCCSSLRMDSKDSSEHDWSLSITDLESLAIY